MLPKQLHCIFFAASVAVFSWLAFFIGEIIDKVTHQPNLFLGGIWAMIATVVVFQAIHALRAMESRRRRRVVPDSSRFTNQPEGMCSKSICER